jgi:hypothetical protein
MRACAPGKLVLSGAYSVLEGAPAIVSAVDRYACCNSARPASLVTDEVRAALPSGNAPEFDAAALRADGRKLGLGSSRARSRATPSYVRPSSSPRWQHIGARRAEAAASTWPPAPMAGR